MRHLSTFAFLLLFAVIPSCTTLRIAAPTSHRRAVRQVIIPAGPLTETLEVIVAPQQPQLPIRCRVHQHGNQQVHTAYSYYGRRWKRFAKIWSVTAALAAAGLAYVYSQENDLGALAGTVFLGFEAIGTTALALKTTRYDYVEREASSSVVARRDCPLGLTFRIANQDFILDERDRLTRTGKVAIAGALDDLQTQTIQVRYREAIGVLAPVASTDLRKATLRIPAGSATLPAKTGLPRQK